MDRHLTKFIDTKIAAANQFVLSRMPLGLTAEECYEELIGTLVGGEAMLKAFRDAAQHLPPLMLHKRVSVAMDGRIVGMALRFTATTKYPHYLLPQAPLFITQASKLYRELSMPVRVARQWEELKFVWENMRNSEPSAVILMHLFPWLREIIAEFDIAALGLDVTATDRRMIEAELKKIRREETPAMFPLLTPELNAVCKSGRELFGQFRMIEASISETTNYTQAPITIEPTPTLVAPWIAKHIGEVMEDWRDAKARYAERAWLKLRESDAFGNPRRRK